MFPQTELASAATATTNPAPTGLGTDSPYSSGFTGYTEVSAAWTSQGVKAFFPNGAKNAAGTKPVPIAFIPSGGAAVTYDVTVWFYDRNEDAWITPANNGTKSLTGPVLDFIENIPDMPTYIQLANVSAGNIQILVDGNFGSVA